MRLKVLTIKNFKGIDEHGIRIELAPITLLFGPNNVGKSTVIQALHLAREVFQGSIPDKIEASKHGVELGAFKDYVHKHDLRRTIQIGFGFDTESDTLFIDKRIGVEISISWNSQLNKAEMIEYAVLVNDKKIAAWQKSVPIEIMNSEISKEAIKANAESYLCVYDTTPFISDADMQQIKAKRDILHVRLTKSETIEQTRQVLNSDEWANFLKAYFKALPGGLHEVSNVNAFLRHLGIGIDFLNDSGIDELYEKPFFTKKDTPTDIANLYRYLLADFPEDSEFINDLINKHSDPLDVFSHLITHFQNDFNSLRRLCEYSPASYPHFADYYDNIDLDIDSIRKKRFNQTVI